MHDYKTYWIDQLLADAEYRGLRFKTMSKNSHFSNIDEELIDIVSADEFVRIESDRVPLFLGSQFGIAPRMNDIEGFFEEVRLCAILGKSMLSGHVAGLTLHRIIDKKTSVRVKHFPNNPL